jgi:hypothetical protein
MASIYKEIFIEATPEHVWDVIRDVGSVHHRLLPDRVTNTRIEGDVRILTFPNGSETRELIVTVDDQMRRLAYAVIETGMPLTYHHATFQVFAANNNHAMLVWITDVLPHSFVEEVRIRIEYGAKDMKKAIEQQGEV